MKTIKDVILSTTRFLIFKNRVYYDKYNNKRNWTMVSRNNNTNAVIIVAITENNKLVITKEFRVPLNDYEYGFPAGLIDKGETIEETAIRELKEETGLDVVEILHTSPFIYNSAGMTDEAIAIVYVKAKGEPTNKFNEQNEDIETFLMDKNEVKSLLQQNVKFGAKGWVIMDYFARNNKIF